MGMILPVLPWTDTPIMFVSNVVKLTSEERLDVIWMRGLEMHSTLRNLFVVVVVMLVRLRCVLSMGQTILNTSAGIAALWRFSSASEQLIFVMLVTMIFKGSQISPNLSCHNVLLAPRLSHLILRSVLFMLNIQPLVKNLLLDVEFAETLTLSRDLDNYLYLVHCD